MAGAYQKVTLSTSWSSDITLPFGATEVQGFLSDADIAYEVRWEENGAATDGDSPIDNVPAGGSYSGIWKNGQRVGRAGVKVAIKADSGTPVFTIEYVR